MSDFAINTNAAADLGRTQAPSRHSTGRAAETPTAAAPSHTGGSDQVEISVKARLLNKLLDSPGVREDLVQRVRDEIDRGAYETPDKVAKAADNLIDDIDLFG